MTYSNCFRSRYIIAFLLFTAILSFTIFAFIKNDGVAETVNIVAEWDFENYDRNNSRQVNEDFWGASNIRISSDESYGYYASATKAQTSATLTMLTPVYLLPDSYVFGFRIIRSGTASVSVTVYNDANKEDGNIVKAFAPTSINDLSDSVVRWDIDIAVAGNFWFDFSIEKDKTNFNFDDFTLYKKLSGGTPVIPPEEPVVEQPEDPPTEETEIDGEHIFIESGVCIKTIKNSHGIRFCGRVDKSYFDGIKLSDNNAEMGMMIAPTDHLSGVEFSASALDSAGKTYSVILADKIFNEDTAVADGYYEFYCSLIDIYPFNIDRNFSARTFVRFADGENTRYIYGEYSAENNSRNAFSVAQTALADTSGFDDDTVDAIRGYVDIIKRIDGVIETANENVYTVTFAVTQKGYFTLKTYGNEFGVLSLNGDENGYSQGYCVADGETTFTFVITVNGEFGDFPVYGKFYADNNAD